MSEMRDFMEIVTREEIIAEDIDDDIADSALEPESDYWELLTRVENALSKLNSYMHNEGSEDFINGYDAGVQMATEIIENALRDDI